MIEDEKKKMDIFSFIAERIYSPFTPDTYTSIIIVSSTNSCIFSRRLRVRGEKSITFY